MGERLERAPLVEALCELRFEERVIPENARITALFERIADEFSEQSVAEEEQVRVSLEGSVPRADVVRDRRFRFSRADGSALVQLGAGVLVINHLPEYGGWESYCPTILKVVRAHHEAVGERSIVRANLRYINRLHAQMTPAKIADLVTVTPSLEGSLKRRIIHFYQRYELSLDEPPGVLVHQTGSLPHPGEPVMMLDLDVSSPMSLKTGDIEGLSVWLKAAHDVISRAFVESLNNHYYQRLKGSTP